MTPRDRPATHSLIDRILDAKADTDLGRHLYQSIESFDPSDDPPWDALSTRERQMWTLAALSVCERVDSLSERFPSLTENRC